MRTKRLLFHFHLSMEAAALQSKEIEYDFDSVGHLIKRYLNLRNPIHKVELLENMINLYGKYMSNITLLRFVAAIAHYLKCVEQLYGPTTPTMIIIHKK